MAFSTDLQDNLLDHMLLGTSYSSPSSHKLALGTDSEGDFMEHSGGNYARKDVSFLLAQGRDMEYAETRNDAAVDFDQASADWSNLTDWAIYDGSSNMLARGVFCDSITVPNGSSLTVGPQELSYRIAQSSYPLSMQRKLLDHVFAGVSWSQPSTIYIAAVLNAVFHGSEAEEPTSGAYARVEHTNWSVGAQAGANVGEVTFPTATADWGTILGIAIFDAISGGNLLALTQLESPVTINNGDIFKIATSSISFRMEEEDSQMVG